MNFTQMLAMEVRPFYDSTDRTLENPANQKRRNESRARMESVLPDGVWMAGPEIARALNTSIDSTNKTLQGFRARDEMMSRVIEGTKRNLEWRWK
jgi:hypothetical protein